MARHNCIVDLFKVQYIWGPVCMRTWFGKKETQYVNKSVTWNCLLALPDQTCLNPIRAIKTHGRAVPYQAHCEPPLTESNPIGKEQSLGHSVGLIPQNSGTTHSTQEDSSTQDSERDYDS